ncbi:MAG TPA: SIMPL domain-containing protein [Thermomicrobiales bacterium]|nr:SIMPL domain-containing protein [Thermomicrobiales bacterium]
MRSNRPLRPIIIVILAALMTIMAFGPTVSAQEAIAPDSLRTITVSGTGIVSVKPDTATVTLGVVHSEDKLKDAQDKVTSDLTEVTAKLKEAGIADDDLATSQYNVRPINEYDRNGNFKGVSSYEVSAALTVTVRDLGKLGDILDAATSAGANQIWGISMYVDDTTEAANQARTAAMADARNRADTFARSEGLLITGVYSVNESMAPQPKAISMDASGDFAAPMAARDEESSPVPISTGTTEIRVEVQVVYIIEQGNG